MAEKYLTKFNTLLLIALAAFAAGGNVRAENEEHSHKLLQPSAWAARGFISPEGDPKCIDEVGEFSIDEELKIICEAAKRGNAQAQHNLGQLFFLTQVAEVQEYDEAYKWFSLAAEQNLPDAQYAIALMHHYGIGIVGDYSLAMKFLLKAANNDHMNAQYLLGLIYASSIRESVKNTDEATKFLRLAAVQGHRLAQEVLTNILKRSALNSGIVGMPAVEYNVETSYAACSEDFDVNNPRYFSNSDLEIVLNDHGSNKSNRYRHFTKLDLNRALNESYEKYVAAMGTCFSSLAKKQGPGYIKFNSP